ncbi:hypothetical protein SBF1_50113 [Candidatus Desulfosporosinus infrequens]|uniref:Holin n=1 Tax=Candidatus Desulfosporosinus infrequens TaxID=2043169 RepID=A0A2U3LHD8_9FIRM|nr:hypothetical protein SBF1_50113 [Candidatus Desulfosporosinus infrequens]
MDMTTITQGVNIAASLAVAVIVAIIGKLHISSKQLATAGELATEAVNFAAQYAEKHGVTLGSGKYVAALASVKELAKKAGISLTDSQWETLIESAYKKAKDELAQLVGTATPYTEEKINAMITAAVQKIAPDALGIVSVVQQELSKIQWAPVVKPVVVTPVVEEKEEQTA